MKQVRRLLASMAALSVALLFTASVPVYARGDSDAGGRVNSSGGRNNSQTSDTTTQAAATTSTTSGGSGNSGSGKSTTKTDDTAASHTETEHVSGHENEAESETKHETEVENHSTASDDTAHTELRHKGDDLVASLRQQRGTNTTPAERQKKCESHKDEVGQHTGKLSTRGQQVQTRIDDIFTKTQAYGDSLTTKPANYDALVAAATAAQATAKSSVASLQTLTPSLDCSSDTAASDVATYKTAVQQARDNLKAYRTAVKNLLAALNTTKTSDDSTSQTSGGN